MKPVTTLTRMASRRAGLPRKYPAARPMPISASVDQQHDQPTAVGDHILPGQRPAPRRPPPWSPPRSAPVCPAGAVRRTAPSSRPPRRPRRPAMPRIPKYGSRKKSVTSSRYITDAVATTPTTKTVSIRRLSPPITSAHSPPTIDGQQQDAAGGHRRIVQPGVQVDRDVLLEQGRDPEHRKREAQEGNECDAVVEDAVLPQRGDDPGDDAEDAAPEWWRPRPVAGSTRSPSAAAAAPLHRCGHYPACRARRTARGTARRRRATADSESTPAGRG